MNGWLRWLRFNAVGALGILVQLGMLALLTNKLHVQYLVATAIAVEAAILHNFVWHERFTWVDRNRRGYMGRLLKFNTTTGLFSIVGNISFTKLLSNAGLGHVAANAGAIILCSVINFLLNDRVVFVPNVET
jgi:putative flippase GtrA